MAGREGSVEEREWIQALYRQAAESQDQAVACQPRPCSLAGPWREETLPRQALLDRLPPAPVRPGPDGGPPGPGQGDGDRAGQLLEHQLLQQASGAQTTLLALGWPAGRAARGSGPGGARPWPGPAAGARPYGGWSVRLQQACLTRNTDAALAALAGAAGVFGAPWPGEPPLCRHLPPEGRGGAGGDKLRPGILRELTDPDNPTYAFLGPIPVLGPGGGRPPPPLKKPPPPGSQAGGGS